MSAERTAELHSEAAPAEHPDLVDLRAGLERIRREVEAGRVEEALRVAESLALDWPEDRTLQHWRQVLRPTTIRLLPPEPARDFEKERKWMREHAHEHAGEWVALKGDRLVCADPSAGAVHRAMADRSDRSELIVCYIPPDSC